MKSVKCIHCGLINWADAEACKRCGNSPQPPAQENFGGWAQDSGPAQGADPTHAAHVHGPGPGYGQAGGHAPYGRAQKRTGLAVASLVLGILSLITLSLFLVGGLTALVLGIVALARARRQPHVYGGSGLAVGGVVTSALSLVIGAPLALILAIAIPNLMASARAANEASAIHGVRELILAEGEYRLTTGDGEFATLEELAGSGLIDAPLVMKNGYLFELTVTDETCTVSAVPIQHGVSGVNSFYAECDGQEAPCDGSKVHYANKRGRPADASDPLVAAPNYGGKREKP